MKENGASVGFKKVEWAIIIGIAVLPGNGGLSEVSKQRL
jgi:hypothetical protein